MGYITWQKESNMINLTVVSKLFRAYGLYNNAPLDVKMHLAEFQSSFELMGYITSSRTKEVWEELNSFQSSFELMGYITYFSQ